MNPDAHKLTESFLKKLDRRDRNVQNKRDFRTANHIGSTVRLAGVLKGQKREAGRIEPSIDKQSISTAAIQYALPPTLPNIRPQSNHHMEEAQHVECEMIDAHREDPIMMLEDDQPTAAKSKSYQEKRKENYQHWDENKEENSKHFVCSHSFQPSSCHNCHCKLLSYNIDCSSCRKLLCGECDVNVHSEMPFHRREFLKPDPRKSKILGPMEFIDIEEHLYSRGNISHLFYN